MAEDTTNLLACNYGTASLVVVDFDVRETPNIDKQLGARVGTFVRVEAECELRGTDPATFATDLLAAQESLRSDGQDFTVTGIGGNVLYTLPASGSIDGGPHCGFQMASGGSALCQKIKLVVTTQQGPSGSNSTPTNSFKVTTAEGPDGLQVVTWTGQIVGVATMAYFLDTVWPAFQTAFGQGSTPAAGPGPSEGTGAGYWSLKGTTNLSQPASNTTQTLAYTLTATEYFGPLPVSQDGTATAVEGSATERVERDEHYRLTTTYDFNVLIAGGGDPIQLLSTLRPTDGVILRESYQIETLKNNTLRGSFTLLASADNVNGPLMNFTQTARLQQQYDVWEEKRYVGTAPILVKAPARLPRLTQSGSSVAAGKFFQPSPIYSIFTSQPEVSLTDENDLEKGSNWNFEMVPMDSGSSPDPLINFRAAPIVRSAQTAAWYPGVTPPASGSSVDGGGGSGAGS